MTSNTKKRAASTTKTDRRTILDLPIRKIHDHIIDAAKSLKAADEALVEYQHILELEENGHAAKKASRALERKVQDALWRVANPHRKRIASLEEEFRARWFIWRAAIPIASISGVPVRYIFYSNELFMERSLTIWIAKGASDSSFKSLGHVIDRDRATVAHSFKRAEYFLERKNPFFMSLLQDLISLEKDLKCLSKK